jgi:hypothetical protein
MSLTTPTTELQAVNQVLATIGESPLESLSDTLPQIGELILETLHRTAREVLSHGWAFNTDYDVTLSPDPATSTISVPEDTLKIDVLFWPGSGVDVISLRGDRLYNSDEGTFEFDDYVRVSLVRALPWDDTPESFRQYVTARTARKIHQQSVGTAGLISLILQDEAQAFRELQRDQSTTRDLSLLTHPASLRFLRRRSNRRSEFYG